MKRYQKDISVKKHIITNEWRPLWKMLHQLPKELKVLSIACAEGFDVWMCKKRGFNAKGIELHRDKVVRGRDHLNLGKDIMQGDIFERFGLIEKANCFIVSRFFHNVGGTASVEIMDKIAEKRDFVVIAKHKPGLFKETGKKRQPLATRKGLSNFFSLYNLVGKSFQSEFFVVGKGKYRGVPEMLRTFLPEPV